MIVIRALDGTAVDVDENAVTLVSGPHPHDVGPQTYVHGVERGVLVTAEGAAALAARLGINPPLAKLTRPNRCQFGSRDLPSPRSAPRCRPNGKAREP